MTLTLTKLKDRFKVRKMSINCFMKAFKISQRIPPRKTNSITLSLKYNKRVRMNNLRPRDLREENTSTK